jgi:hypothetical protein
MMSATLRPIVDTCSRQRAGTGIPGKDGAERPRRRPPLNLLESTMALLRRALVALGIAGFIAGVLRLRGTGGTPPQDGGWRELSGPELR